jgi:hypothetical protein
MLTNFLSENFRLKKDQIFEGLSPEEMDVLIGSGVTHSYKKGEIIFREGGIVIVQTSARRGVVPTTTPMPAANSAVV